MRLIFKLIGMFFSAAIWLAERILETFIEDAKNSPMFPTTTRRRRYGFDSDDEYDGFSGGVGVTAAGGVEAITSDGVGLGSRSRVL